jgi:hypothetical protein
VVGIVFSLLIERTFEEEELQKMYRPGEVRNMPFNKPIE